MFRCEGNNLVGQPSNNRQQGDTYTETSPEGGHWDDCVNQNGNDHHRYQKTGSTARMIGAVFLYCRDFERITILERVNRLVLGPVILIHAANVFKQRPSPDKQQEQSNADNVFFNDTATTQTYTLFLQGE